MTPRFARDRELIHMINFHVTLLHKPSVLQISICPYARRILQSILILVDQAA